MQDWLPQVFTNAGVVAVAFILLDRRVGKIEKNIEEKIHNGITTSLNELAKDVEYMKGRLFADHAGKGGA